MMKQWCKLLLLATILLVMLLPAMVLADAEDAAEVATATEQSETALPETNSTEENGTPQETTSTAEEAPDAPVLSASSQGDDAPGEPTGAGTEAPGQPTVDGTDADDADADMPTYIKGSAQDFTIHLCGQDDDGYDSLRETVIVDRYDDAERIRLMYVSNLSTIPPVAPGVKPNRYDYNYYSVDQEHRDDVPVPIIVWHKFLDILTPGIHSISIQKTTSEPVEPFDVRNFLVVDPNAQVPEEEPTVDHNPAQRTPKAWSAEGSTEDGVTYRFTLGTRSYTLKINTAGVTVQRIRLSHSDQGYLLVFENATGAEELSFTLTLSDSDIREGTVALTGDVVTTRVRRG